MNKNRICSYILRALPKFSETLKNLCVFHFKVIKMERNKERPAGQPNLYQLDHPIIINIALLFYLSAKMSIYPFSFKSSALI